MLEQVKLFTYNHLNIDTKIINDLALDLVLRSLLSNPLCSLHGKAVVLFKELQDRQTV